MSAESAGISTQPHVNVYEEQRWEDEIWLVIKVKTNDKSVNIWSDLCILERKEQRCKTRLDTEESHSSTADVV